MGKSLCGGPKNSTHESNMGVLGEGAMSVAILQGCAWSAGTFYIMVQKRIRPPVTGIMAFSMHYS